MKPILTIDYIVIAIYMLLTVIIGCYFIKFNKTGSDFFRGGNKIPWIIAGLSSFMSGFSAWTFTGAAGIAYKEGITIIFMYIGNSLAFFVGYFVFAKPWRRTRISTVMEYLHERYDEPTRQTFSWLTTIFQLFMGGSILYGLGVFLSSVCGFPLIWTIIIAGLIILIYSFLGGLWAVMITDFIQGVILIPFTIVMFIVALNRIGGISSFMSSLPPFALTLGHSEKSMFGYIICFAIVNLFAYNTSVNAQRYFSVDNERSAKKVALFTGSLYILGTFIWFIPPMAMRILYPNIAQIFPNLPNPEEASYALASLTLLPNGLIGIMLAAMFSASMSSLSSFYNMHSAILSKDIFQTIFKIENDENKLLILGRIMTLVVGIIVPVIAIIMVVNKQSVFETMLTFNTIISLAYGIPALLGLVEKRAPNYSGLLSFSVALILGVLSSFIFKWDFVTRVSVIVPAGILVYYLCILFKEKPSFADKRKLFFKKLDTPVDVNMEVGEKGNVEFFVFRFLSRVTVFISIVCLILSFSIPLSENKTFLMYIAITLFLGILFKIKSMKSAPEKLYTKK